MDIGNITSQLGSVSPTSDIRKDHKAVFDKALAPESSKHGVSSLIEKPDRTEASTLRQQDNRLEEKRDENDELDKAIADVNDFFQNERRKLSFTVNEEINDVIIEVKDLETDEVIRQIPSELVVKLAEQLNELTDGKEAVGVLLKEKA